jgi:hypothetical protein
MRPAQIRAQLKRFLEGHAGEVGLRAMWNIT